VVTRQPFAPRWEAGSISDPRPLEDGCTGILCRTARPATYCAGFSPALTITIREINVGSDFGAQLILGTISKGVVEFRGRFHFT